MKFCKIFMLLSLWIAGVMMMSGHASAQSFVVDDDSQCSGANFTSIQAAVDAVPVGSTISVCPGIYDEQVRVGKSLSIKSVGTDNQNQVVIRPTRLVQSADVEGTPVIAIVFIGDTTNVNLEGLTIDGAANDVIGCEPFLIGVLYYKASGLIRDSIVKNIRLRDPQQAGCQSGVGIFVLSGNDADDAFSNVQILGNRIFDYQKAGIAANDAHTEVAILNNTVTGDGAIATNAQDGIQVAFGARGTVSNNTIGNHIYTPCDTYENCTFAGKNIIVFQSNDVTITGNNLSNSQLNIRVTGSRTNIRDNTIVNAVTRDAIFVVGDFNDIISNSITQASAAAIFVRGRYNTVANNTIDGARTGIQESAPGSDNVFLANTFANTERQMLLLSPTAAIGGQAFALASDNTPLPLSGVRIALNGGGAIVTTVTDADGRYAFTNLAAATYTVTPDLRTDYAFNPASRYVMLSGTNISDADFIGTPPDSVPPRVTINRAARQPDTTSLSPVNFTVTFSEAVTGFDSSDVILGGTARPTTAIVTPVSGSANVFNVVVGGFTTSGTVTASITANAARDSQNELSLPSISNDNTVTYNAPDNITDAIVVTSIADSGAGSLREAINLANADGGTDTISFNINTGSQVFNLTSALPTILDALTIEGATQPGFDGSPLIMLDGASAGANTHGLNLNANNITVRGIAIKNFGGDGIHISDANNSLVERNVIANNSSVGVAVQSGTGNRITNNSIAMNGGLGIDLGEVGGNANDARDTDEGANNLQNNPIIFSASPGSTRLTGTLNSTPNSTFVIEFFKSTVRNDSVFREGQIPIGFIEVTTDMDGNSGSSTTPGVTFTGIGGTTFNITFAANSTSDDFITATATNAAGNTSEFSPAMRVMPRTTADTLMISGTIRDTSGAGLANVNVHLSGAVQDFAMTGGDGHYRFTVPADGIYHVGVSARGYRFSPATRTFGSVVADEIADFTAVPIKGRVLRRSRGK